MNRKNFRNKLNDLEDEVHDALGQVIPQWIKKEGEGDREIRTAASAKALLIASVQLFCDLVSGGETPDNSDPELNRVLHAAYKTLINQAIVEFGDGDTIPESQFFVPED